MTWTKPSVTGALVVCLAATLSGCSSSSSSAPAGSARPGYPRSTLSAPANASITALQAPPPTKVALTEAGSTLLLPLFQAWAPAFQRANPTVSLAPKGGGSGAGISGAAAGTVSIGGSDAYLSAADMRASPGLLNIPIGISAQEVDYNVPGVTGNLKLTGRVLSAIYQGQVTVWNDPRIASLNRGVRLPDLPIVPLHRSDASGGTFLFTQYLSRADPAGWASKVGSGTLVAFPAVAGQLVEAGNQAMITGCQAAPGCVAYVGISHQSRARAAGLGQAEIDNASGQFVLPGPSTISQAAATVTGRTPPGGAASMVFARSGYPLSSYEYAIVRTVQANPATAQAVQAFVSWAIDPAKGASPAYLGPLTVLPLPSQVVQISANELAELR